MTNIVVRSVDVDVLDVAVVPELVDLAEPVDVGHHRVDGGLVGEVRQRWAAGADARLVEPSELDVNLGDRRDLLGVGGQLGAERQRVLHLAGDPLADRVRSAANEHAELLERDLAERRVDRLSQTRADHLLTEPSERVLTGDGSNRWPRP